MKIDAKKIALDIRSKTRPQAPESAIEAEDFLDQDDFLAEEAPEPGEDQAAKRKARLDKIMRGARAR